MNQQQPTAAPGFDRDQVQHAVVGYPDAPAVSDADWPAWSAGFEAGMREGIKTTDLRISVELVPTGPTHAGLRLWRAVTSARLQHRSTSPETAPLSGQQLREQARASWGLPARGRDQQRRQA